MSNLEPIWKVLNLSTLKSATAEVLDFTTGERTIKGAHAEVDEWLRTSGRDLAFTCETCNSRIDLEMPKCWACGLLFSDDDDEPVVDSEVVERAKRLGIVVGDQSRDQLLRSIEEVETRKRRVQSEFELMEIESNRLNEKLTQGMPDGWSKSRSKQYTSYFDGGKRRRIAVWNRGFRVDFSVEDGYLDGFPDLEFVSEEDRQKKHFGRTNYVFGGDSSKLAYSIAKRVFEKYQ